MEGAFGSMEMLISATEREKEKKEPLGALLTKMPQFPHLRHRDVKNSYYYGLSEKLFLCII